MSNIVLMWCFSKPVRWGDSPQRFCNCLLLYLFFRQIYFLQEWVVPCLLILAPLPSILSLTAGTERAVSSCTRDESKKALSKGVD